MEKQWKQIKNFEGKYLVSNYGEIKSLKTNKLLKQYTNKTKYLYVMLGRKHYRVNRLVAQAFIPNPLNKEFVNHKDYNTLNNNADNLDWVSMEENIDYSRKNVLLGIKKRIAIYGK